MNNNKGKQTNMSEENLSRQILSDVIVFTKYARYDEKKKRRENWSEIIDRYKKMMIKFYPKLKDEIEENCKYLYEKKVLPSSRSLQFGGKAIEKNFVRQYNCSGVAVDHPDVFKEVMFLLLSGSGVGVSVQQHHIGRLPEIHKPRKKRRFLIGDSIENWAEAIGVLIAAYMGDRKSLPIFDFSDIRPKGTPLKTSGSTAPGSADLQVCMVQLQNILNEKEDGDKLTSVEVLDMLCHIASCVVSGGVRRSSMLALFSFDDNEAKEYKGGDWVTQNPQRAMINISAAILRHKIKEEEFFEYFEYMRNGFGEPSIFWTNDAERGLTNPCGEAALKPGQFCNLTTINTTDLVTQEEFNKRARVASFFGSIQAGLCDFHFLREFWKEITEEEALIGVSLAGIASGNVLSLNVKEAAKEVLKENERVSEIIGTNKAARTTLLKPEGTTACLLACSSGIHAYHADYYIRRVKILKTESIYKYLVENHPELIEDDVTRPTVQSILAVPIKAPEGSITRKETALQLLGRVKRLYKDWVLVGHRSGQNTHSISCTVTVKPNEWEKVGNWFWTNRDFYASISTFPYDDTLFPQMPFEEIDEEKYNKMLTHLKKVDLSKIKENEDNTNLQAEVACAAGACEIV